jgi:hypothetical protein
VGKAGLGKLIPLLDLDRQRTWLLGLSTSKLSRATSTQAFHGIVTWLGDFYFAGRCGLHVLSK